MNFNRSVYVLSLSYLAVSDQWTWMIDTADTGRTVQDARTSCDSICQAVTEGKAALATLNRIPA